MIVLNHADLILDETYWFLQKQEDTLGNRRSLRSTPSPLPLPTPRKRRTSSPSSPTSFPLITESPVRDSTSNLLPASFLPLSRGSLSRTRAENSWLSRWDTRV